MPGTLSYYEICNNTINNGWSVSRDIANKRGPFAFKGNQWVSFDDVDNIRAKAHYIRDKNLGKKLRIPIEKTDWLKCTILICFIEYRRWYDLDIGF